MCHKSNDFFFNPTTYFDKILTIFAITFHH